MGNFSLEFEQFPAELSALRSSGNSLQNNLELIFKYANFAVESRQWRGEILYLPQLDQAILDLSKHPELPTMSALSAEQLSPNYVILVTEVYVTGGHGRVMNRFAEELPSHIIFTDLFGRLTSGNLALTGLVSNQSLSCTIVSGDSFTQKLRSLLALLDAFKPKGLILLGHHQDVLVQLAGVIYSGGSRTSYFHHCDHEPALGALIRYPIHIDTIEEIASICAGRGLAKRLWPMTVPPPDLTKNVLSGLKRVATCGSSIKFEGQFNEICYKDIVNAVLSTDDEITLLHIGPLSESYVFEIQEHLRNSSINPLRFIYIGPVENLRSFLIESQVDLYIQSFPAAGGLTAIEVQSVGIPAVYANPDLWSAKLIGSRSVYASRDLEWSSVEDIPLIIGLALADRNWINYCRAAIEMYEVSFLPERGASFFSDF